MNAITGREPVPHLWIETRLRPIDVYSVEGVARVFRVGDWLLILCYLHADVDAIRQQIELLAGDDAPPGQEEP